MSHLSIAGLQLELGIEDNLSTIEQEIDLVKKRFPWVQMVVLPELCTYAANTKMAVQLPGEVEIHFRPDEGPVRDLNCLFNEMPLPGKNAN